MTPLLPELEDLLIRTAREQAETTPEPQRRWRRPRTGLAIALGAVLATGVAAMLERLPPAQREAIDARVLREEPYAEIASQLGCSESVVRQRVRASGFSSARSGRAGRLQRTRPRSR